jgi:predicted O-linked N-acetylglucosamine transferase (SPINDLY family)
MRDSPFGDPRFQDAFRSLEQAVALQRQGQFDEADKTFARLVKKNPDYFDALHFYGLFKYQRGQLGDALKLVGKATKLNPRSTNALNSLGVILARLKRHGEALASFDAGLKLDPNHVQALSNRCNSLNELGRYDEAIKSSERVLAVDPNYPEVYVPRGAALIRAHRYKEALDSYQYAVRLNPSAAMAWVGLGHVYFELKRYEEAASAYDKAIALKSDLEQGWLGRGHVLFELKRYEEALLAYDKALSLRPDPGTESLSFSARLFVCDWKNFDAERAKIVASVRNRKTEVNPFLFVAVSSSPEEQLQCARSWVAAKYPAAETPLWRSGSYSHDKIRIAYVSADFRFHATSALIAGLFESHDKSRFELTGISIGSGDQSEVRRRITDACDHFIEGMPLSDEEIASQVKAKEVDILIDLMGIVRHSRIGIFARRAAPVQANYLGYPGTTGASYIDYVIADRTTIPESHRRYYSEKVAYLPDTYQVNDDKRRIADKTFTRAECGLPEQGFVFCCFNNNYKILPNVFDGWMKILKRVDGSVFWLLEDNDASMRNLRREAVARNVNADRLVFAKRIPMAEHLARHRVADLFLDTLPYNAHTTASDALWVGLPVLTRIGETFAARVAASLLQAIGIPELITSTQQDYTERAIELATEPDKLVALRQKLQRNRREKPLFNTQLFTRHIESAYQAMYERYRSGLPPDIIEVAF